MTACTTCAKPLGPKNKSGLCRICHCAGLNGDPAMVAHRIGKLREKYANDPEWVQGKREMLREVSRRPHVRELRRVAGRTRARETLHRPDVFARSQTPDARARAGRAHTETRLAWCPPELRDEYRELVRSKAANAAQARAVISERIPGTPEHASREVANNRLSMQLKHARQQAQEY